MANIRSFRNGDLPALARIWVQHWAAVDQSPPVSAAIIEQALLSRTFFDFASLTVAVHDGLGGTNEEVTEPSESIQAWSHYAADGLDATTAVVNAICFSPDGLHSCDQLLDATEKRISEQGFRRIVVGSQRNEHSGYVGLPPLGHGIGVSATDSRSSSLLSRHSYVSGQPATRLVATTNPYRMPVSREGLQLRRTTRLEKEVRFPEDARLASAMAHLDIEQHNLVNHRTGELLASMAIWLSDPEAQVMDCSEAILDLGGIHDRSEATPAEFFLIGSIMQSLANRRVFRAETSVDSDKSLLIDQLTKLNFQSLEQGQCWVKELS